MDVRFGRVRAHRWQSGGVLIVSILDLCRVTPCAPAALAHSTVDIRRGLMAKLLAFFPRNISFPSRSASLLNRKRGQIRTWLTFSAELAPASSARV